MEEKDDILGVLADHWEGLGKQDESCEAIDRGIGGRVDEGCEQVRIRFDAVLGIVKKLKRGKAVGPDDVSNEMLKFGGGRVVQTLCDVLGEVVSKGSVPDVWMRSFIVPIFKGGEQELPGNYRGIALGSCVAKVMARVICEQLGEFAEDMILTEEQGGFRENRGCSDQILALRSICEVRKEQKKSTYLAFLDVSKAYDTVWREGLWEKMRRYGVGEGMITVCKAMYKNVKASVLLDGEESRWWTMG